VYLFFFFFLVFSFSFFIITFLSLRLSRFGQHRIHYIRPITHIEILLTKCSLSTLLFYQRLWPCGERILCVWIISKWWHSCKHPRRRKYCRPSSTGDYTLHNYIYVCNIWRLERSADFHGPRRRHRVSEMINLIIIFTLYTSFDVYTNLTFVWRRTFFFFF
jgi:hypothetical protein